MINWEAKLVNEYSNTKGKINLRRKFLETLDTFFSQRKCLPNKLPLRMLRLIRSYDGLVAFYFRSIITRTFKFDPFEKKNADPIAIAVLIAEKDIQILPYSIASTVQSVKNPITRIFVICPSSIDLEVSQIVNDIQESIPNVIHIYSDEEILNSSGLKHFKFSSSVAKMEILKICIPLTIIEDVLVIDGDTLLLRERNWLSSGVQISPIAQEYLLGHNIFACSLFGEQNRSGLGFVTHHGLFRSSITAKLVKEVGGMTALAESIDFGVKVGWNATSGFPSEWQLYGEYIFTRTPKIEAIPSSFINLGISRSIIPLVSKPSFVQCNSLVLELRELLPILGSLSLHGYK